MSEQHQEQTGGRPPRGVLWAAAIVVLAVAGIVAGLLASGSHGGTPGASGGTTGGSAGTSAPGTAPGGSPATTPPASPAASSQGAGTGGGQVTGTKIYLNGQVTAVSATSISIMDVGPAVTAAIIPATRYSGQLHGIRDVRVGYQVSAEILDKHGRATVMTLRYPAAHPGNIP